MSSYINYCAWRDVQIATFKKMRVFFPCIHLDMTGDINCAAPASIAQHAFNHLVYHNLLAINFDQLFCSILLMISGCQVSAGFFMQVRDALRWAGGG